MTDEAALVRTVLREWGVVPDDVSCISRRGNTHWLVRRAEHAFVLRRYRAGQSRPSIEYEFAVLRHLRARDWPVPAPVDGLMRHQDSAFALFPLLPGRPWATEDAARRRARGRLLAGLHGDLAGLAGLGQRDGWLRSDEVVLPAGEGVAGGPSVTALRAHRDGVRDRLARAGAADLPVMVVHGDLISQNVLFDRGAVSGVLDFDSTHLDLRAVDVACARRSGADDVVLGYLEAGTLSSTELGCLDDLWRASVLRYGAMLMAGTTGLGGQDVDREMAWCLRQLDKTRPFPRC